MVVTPNSTISPSFKRVAAYVLLRLPLRIKFWALLAWLLIGGAVCMTYVAATIQHRHGGWVLIGVAFCAAYGLLAIGARYWNQMVMPTIFETLWRMAADRDVTDKYAALIRMRPGVSMDTIARRRGFVRLVRRYCAACRA